MILGKYQIEGELEQRGYTYTAKIFDSQAKYYFGKWLKYGGNFPDYQLRLFKKGKGRFPAKHVHERLEIEGKTGYLKKHLEHYPYHTISEYFRKFNFYTSFEALSLQKKEIKINFINSMKYIIFKPVVRSVRRYIFKGGF